MYGRAEREEVERRTAEGRWGIEKGSSSRQEQDEHEEELFAMTKIEDTTRRYEVRKHHFHMVPTPSSGGQTPSVVMLFYFV